MNSRNTKSVARVGVASALLIPASVGALSHFGLDARPNQQLLYVGQWIGYVGKQQVMLSLDKEGGCRLGTGENQGSLRYVGCSSEMKGEEIVLNSCYCSDYEGNPYTITVTDHIRAEDGGQTMRITSTELNSINNTTKQRRPPVSRPGGFILQKDG